MFLINKVIGVEGGALCFIWFEMYLFDKKKIKEKK